MEGNAPDETQPPSITMRHKLSLRGHMILDSDDPLPVADTPADPPPITPISTTGQPLQGS
jgi:hypothetical protein